MKKTIIAIDPGAGGGIAIQTGDKIWCEPMSETVGDLKDFLAGIEGEKVAYLEDIPKCCGGKLPESTTFVMAQSFGRIEGLLNGLGIKTIMVRPVEWQKNLGVGKRSGCASKGEWKNKLKAEAQRRFPFLKITLKTSDALLILDYATRKEGAI